MTASSSALLLIAPGGSAMEDAAKIGPLYEAGMAEDGDKHAPCGQAMKVKANGRVSTLGTSRSRGGDTRPLNRTARPQRLPQSGDLVGADQHPRGWASIAARRMLPDPRTGERGREGMRTRIRCRRAWCVMVPRGRWENCQPPIRQLVGDHGQPRAGAGPPRSPCNVPNSVMKTRGFCCCMTQCRYRWPL